MAAVMRRRVWIGLSLIVLVPIGIGTKFYGGWGAVWVRDYLGGMLYEIFWCLAVWFLWPRASVRRIAGGVFVATCGLEVLQLWHPVWLEVLRRSFWGQVVLGTSFDWWDFPHYALGCALGWGWMRLIGCAMARRSAG